MKIQPNSPFTKTNVGFELLMPCSTTQKARKINDFPSFLSYKGISIGFWFDPLYFLLITSIPPIYGCKTFGIFTLPSSC